MNRLFVAAFLFILNIIYALSAPASSLKINNSGFNTTSIDSLNNGKWILTGMNGSIYTSDNIANAFSKKMTLANSATYRKASIGNDWILNVMLPNSCATKFVRYRSDKDTVELIKSISNQLYSSVTSQGGKIFASGAAIVGTSLKGTIISSSDEGKSWKTLYQTSNTQVVMSIVAQGSDTLLACGMNGLLAYSYDKGATWNEEYIGSNIDLNQILLLGNKKIIASEKSGVFYFDDVENKWVHLELSSPINDDISLGLVGDNLYIVTNTTGTKGIIVRYNFATKEDDVVLTSPDESFSALYVSAPDRFYIGTYSGNILEVSGFTPVEESNTNTERTLETKIADRGEMLQFTTGAESISNRFDWCIFDVLGNVVSKGSSSDANFYVGAPDASGKYFISIRSANGTTIEGLIVR